MSRKLPLKEELELHELREKNQQLLLRQREAAAIPRRLALEQEERERTMPPLAEVAERERRIAHEDTLSRGAATNILREQKFSLLLVIMLLAATGTLIWWGIRLMQG